MNTNKPTTTTTTTKIFKKNPTSTLNIVSIHQMNNEFEFNNYPMEGPPMHNNRDGMMPSNMHQMPGDNMPNPMNQNQMSAIPMGGNPMNANPMNSNTSSMNSLGQLAQMDGNPNSHMNMNMSSPNGHIYNRPENSSPSIPVNSPTMVGPNGNRVPGSARPHMGMNSPNMAMNQMNLNSMNNMNAPPMMGGPIPPMANGNHHPNQMNPNMMPMQSNQSPSGSGSKRKKGPISAHDILNSSHMRQINITTVMGAMNINNYNCDCHQK